MKVLYKNKVEKLVPLYTSLDCNNCIYYPKGAYLGRCKKSWINEIMCRYF